jgi:alkanesulfonate monooxygenase SsuD/methylene tetrahydromethanopterin reductase-like flavin-dependent oxidoreductase (luciferase family)
MKFGIQFFPDVSPQEKSARDYFRECLDIAEEADRLGYTHVRTVEHYFHPYGGYSPNPIVFLSAAAQRTKRVRIVTGAVLPVFNNPLKLAGEIGMLDAISDGRLDVGFARAFLPHEFRRHGISPNESVARFREGLEQVELLLTQENVTHHGQFHNIESTTSLPRPTQLPRPPFYIAAVTTAESFEFAGRMGHNVMAVPLGGAKMAEMLNVYRSARRAAGHPGDGEVMLAMHMFCHEDRQKARELAAAPFQGYLDAVCDAASDWATGPSSTDYPGYDKMIAGIKAATMDSQIGNGTAWIGTPDDIIAAIRGLHANIRFEHASLQVNFNLLPFAEALRSIQLFAREVMPHFAPELSMEVSR